MRILLPAIILLFFVFPTRVLHAQSPADSSNTDIHADPALTLLLEKRKAIGIKNMKGYRVKIHFGAEKAKANDVKARFTQKHADIPAYLDYDTPNFSITVGNFKTRLEAFKVYKQIQSEFPNAFIVEMKIDYPDIPAKKAPPAPDLPDHQ
jgi:hypothetical protein